MKKTFISSLILLLSVTFSLKSQNHGTIVTDAILKTYSAKMFTSGPVKDSDLEVILKCGLKAPSSRNSQNWKFTVIKDPARASDVIADITPGNVLIIVSGLETKQPGANPDFDCALATENMYIAAQGLGYGAHIYASPVSALNQNRNEYGIPADYRVISVLRIGNIDKNIDATSSASTRKTIVEVVNYK